MRVFFFMKNKNNINKLKNIMKKLRDPIDGCPWDKKQTLESIIPYAIEEVYEVAEEIYKKKYNNLKEELGDLLFQIIYLSQIANEKKKFNFDDVVNSIIKKMMYRHPHVFKNKKFKNLNEFKDWWEKSKKKNSKYILEDIPDSLPALNKANKIQKIVSKAGFEYNNTIDCIDKVIEEANELKIEIKRNNKSKIKEELGDMIFASLDVARILKLHPEIILAKSNQKFTKRWNKLEKKMMLDKKKFKDLKNKDFENYWKKIKN